MTTTEELRVDWPQQKLTIPHLSIVVPTYNEAENVAELVDQLYSALPPDIPCEILFIDDSTDETPHVISSVAELHDMPISVNHREDPIGGLGGAVVEGLHQARGEWIVIMDGDLQHPPEVIPALLSAGRDEAAELVVATRYATGGSSDGLSGGIRHAISQMCTVLARLLFPRVLAGVSDPMSGFFLVRASTLDLASLRPLGYKILLELIVRTRPRHITEVPYQFQERHAGESKSSLRESLRFFQHLTRLRLSAIDFATPLVRKLAFGAVGLSGFLPNLSVLWLLTTLLAVPYALATVFATQVAIAWNFLLTDRVMSTGDCRWGWWWRFCSFAALNNSDLLLRIPLLILLVDSTGIPLLPATVVTLLTAFAVRFVVTDRLIYLGAHRTPDTGPEE